MLGKVELLPRHDKEGRLVWRNQMKFMYLVEGSGGYYDNYYTFPVAVHDTEEAALAWVDEYNQKVKDLQSHCRRLAERAWKFTRSLEERYDTSFIDCKVKERYWKLFIKTVPPQQECLQKILEDYNDVAEFHRFEVKIVMRKK